MRRRISRQILARRTALIAAAAMAITVPASAAHAQLGGKLRKLGGDIVKDAAGLPPDAPKAASASSNNATITPERLEAVIAVLTPLVAEAEAAEKAGASRRDYELWARTYTNCVETAAKAVGMPSTDGIEKSSEITAKQGPMMERMAKYIQANNQRALHFIQDTLKVLSFEAQTAMFGITKCGKPRYAPREVIEQDVARALGGPSEVTESGPVRKIAVPSAQRGGMTHYQFGMVRERMALWSLMQAGAIPPDRGGKNGVFSDAERAALEARGAEIAKFAPLFRTNTLMWGQWSDISLW